MECWVEELAARQIGDKGLSHLDSQRLLLVRGQFDPMGVRYGSPTELDNG